MKVLAIDIGGTHVKILATGQQERREFPSGPTLTAEAMVAGVKALAKGWKYDVVAAGYPGPVMQNRPVAEPHNLAPGWVGFNYEAAFGCPVKIVNDAAMQALGSYRKGKMLFLGLGTGLGSTLVVDGIVEPMELGHLPYKKATYEDYVGLRGRRGARGRQRQVAEGAAARMPGGRQHQCFRWRVSSVGERGRAAPKTCRIREGAAPRLLISATERKEHTDDLSDHPCHPAPRLEGPRSTLCESP